MLESSPSPAHRLSSTKLVPGAKKVGDRCLTFLLQGHRGGSWSAQWCEVASKDSGQEGGGDAT